jgi:hypothetical protein
LFKQPAGFLLELCPTSIYSCTDKYNLRQASVQKIIPCYNPGMADNEETRGRPELPEKERRETRFQIRLSATELALVERAADGKTSTWARETLLKAAKRRLRAE